MDAVQGWSPRRGDNVLGIAFGKEGAMAIEPRVDEVWVEADRVLEERSGSASD